MKLLVTLSHIKSCQHAPAAGRHRHIRREQTPSSTLSAFYVKVSRRKIKIELCPVWLSSQISGSLFEETVGMESLSVIYFFRCCFGGEMFCFVFLNNNLCEEVLYDGL